MDIKQTLMNLGEKLIREHKFKPATFKCRRDDHETRSTDPLIEFVLWLDRTPEAREELEKEGILFIRTSQFFPKAS